jgi:hypothetical protein
MDFPVPGAPCKRMIRPSRLFELVGCSGAEAAKSCVCFLKEESEGSSIFFRSERITRSAKASWTCSRGCMFSTCVFATMALGPASCHSCFYLLQFMPWRLYTEISGGHNIKKRGFKLFSDAGGSWSANCSSCEGSIGRRHWSIMTRLELFIN